MPQKENQMRTNRNITTQSSITPNAPKVTWTTEREYWSPERAYAELEKQDPNYRVLYQNLVDKYAGDMSRGDWRFDPQTLKFDNRGVPSQPYKLVDGQHRLWGVVESNIGRYFMVDRGEIDVSQLDTGKERRVVDQIRNDLKIKYAAKANAGMNSIRELTGGARKGASKAQTYRMLEHYRDGINFLFENLPSTGPFRKKFLFGPFILAYTPQNSEMLRDLLVQITDESVGVTEGSPALAVRRYFSRGFYLADATNARIQSLKILQAISCHLQGRSCPNLVKAGEETVKFFSAGHERY